MEIGFDFRRAMGTALDAARDAEAAAARASAGPNAPSRPRA